MPLPLPDLDLDLSGLSRDDWIQRIDDLGEEHGYLEQLGPQHAALFIDVGPKLLVTFEQMDDILNRKDAVPRGFSYATKNGWSLLCLIAEGQTWFRQERVYRYFDRLTDDGFFEDFDETLFYGHHDCGYAAAAFSVVSPGSRVLALRPMASQSPDVARWDRRYPKARRLDFNSRYGFAPDMIEATDRAYVAVDPYVPSDAMHAALFRRSNTTVLSCPYAGPRIEALWDMMEIMPGIVEDAMTGTLSALRFGQYWRARRDNGPYLRTLYNRLIKAGRTGLAMRLCRHCLDGSHGAYFAERLAELGHGRASTAAQ